MRVMSDVGADLPRIWDDPSGFFAEAAPEGRRPHELARGCIEYIEQARAHPPRLRRAPGIVQVVEEVRAWGLANLTDLDEPGTDALRDVLERLAPFAGQTIDELAARVRARVDLMRLRRQGRPSQRLLALCEATVAAVGAEDMEELHDRFSPVDRELRAGLLELETRYPDLAELVVPPFEEPVQAYAIERADRVRAVRKGVLAASVVLTVATFLVRCT